VVDGSSKYWASVSDHHTFSSVHHKLLRSYEVVARSVGLNISFLVPLFSLFFDHSANIQQYHPHFIQDALQLPASDCRSRRSFHNRFCLEHNFIFSRHLRQHNDCYHYFHNDYHYLPGHQNLHWPNRHLDGDRGPIPMQQHADMFLCPPRRDPDSQDLSNERKMYWPNNSGPSMFAL